MTCSDRIIKRKAKNNLCCRGCGKAVFKDQEIIEIPPQKREIIFLCMSCCKQIGEMALSNNNEEEVYILEPETGASEAFGKKLDELATIPALSAFEVLEVMNTFGCSVLHAKKILLLEKRR